MIGAHPDRVASFHLETKAWLSLKSFRDIEEVQFPSLAVVGRSSFAMAPIFAEKLRRGETAGQGIARRKVRGSGVNLTTMTDSLHSRNSNHRVKGFASRGFIVLS